jgi:hypothetical protein
VERKISKQITVKKLTDGEIVNKVLDALNITANSLVVKLKYKSPATVYHIINGINKISDGFITRTVTTFPNVSYKFMKEGEGDVLLKEDARINPGNFFNVADRKSDFEEFGNLPAKIDKLIYLQTRTNELLEIYLTQKKAAD